MGNFFLVVRIWEIGVQCGYTQTELVDHQVVALGAKKYITHRDCTLKMLDVSAKEVVNMMVKIIINVIVNI